MYLTKKINDRLILIMETHPDKNIVFCMQLVIGTQKAALIDAGLEKSNEFPALIRRFTDLPVILCLTHGHSDHVGNAPFFSDIRIGEADAQMLPDNLAYTALHHGDRIDLGDTVLEAYSLPGHTDGAFCFLNRNDHYALTGDIVNCETWLCWDSCAAPKEYADRISSFRQTLIQDGIDTIWEGHSRTPHSAAICTDMITALHEIAAGNTRNDPVHHEEGGRNKYAHTSGRSTILYDRNVTPNSQ